MPSSTYPAHDIERKALAERLEALARLSGTIAHDLNNQLTAVLGYAEVLATTTTSNPSLTHIRSAGEQAATYTRNLMDVSRHKRALLRDLDVATVLQDAGPTLVDLAPATCRCIVGTCPDPFTFACDRAQLEHVFHLVVRNGIEAGATEINIAAGGNASGDAVVIAITDNGSGIASEVLPQCFEPLYTTKGEKGRGLGLTDATLTVHRLGGSLTVTSECDVGTTVMISFPRVH